MVEVKLCRDCRFVRKEGAVALCSHPEIQAWFIDFHDGGKRFAEPPVEIPRYWGACGLDAVLWEPAHHA